MSAIVRVFDHPELCAASETTGGSRSAAWQPGQHEVVAWHERVGEAKASLLVAAGQSTDAAFTLPLAD